MRRLLFPLILLFLPSWLFGQNITLQECLSESLKNNPLSGNKALAGQIAQVHDEIWKSAWLPGLDMNAQATWQSDVVTLNLNLPFPVDFPQIPRDQYKVTADVTQLIFDGGNIRNQKVIEDINSRLSVQQVVVGEYELKQTVEDLFFAILANEKRIEVLNLMNKSLLETIGQVESRVRNGLLSETDLAVLRAEKIKVDQQVIGLGSINSKALKTLSILMGRDLPVGSRLLLPDESAVLSPAGVRPELDLFNIQDNLLDARKNLLQTQRLPRVMAFGQAGYGKPGLNFLGDKWQPYLVVGLKGTWNIWDWSRVSRQKSSLTLNQRMIDNQKESFNRQVSQSEARQKLEIGTLDSLLATDSELLKERQIVTSAYDSKLKNGLITASQYMTEWTREQEARINMEVRKIERVSARYKLMSIQGKL
jgi:outer membrane protein TolC